MFIFFSRNLRQMNGVIPYIFHCKIIQSNRADLTISSFSLSTEQCKYFIFALIYSKSAESAPRPRHLMVPQISVLLYIYIVYRQMTRMPESLTNSLLWHCLVALIDTSFFLWFILRSHDNAFSWFA